jgi:hypothetical protein
MKLRERRLMANAPSGPLGIVQDYCLAIAFGILMNVIFYPTLPPLCRNVVADHVIIVMLVLSALPVTTDSIPSVSVRTQKP